MKPYSRITSMSTIALLPHWRKRRLVFSLIIVWVLIMIALPIVRYTAPTAVFHATITMSVVLQTAAVVAVVQEAWGWQRTLQTAVVVGILSWAVEAVGSTTGYPFGDYTYTKILQPQVADVPFVIPLAWFMMLPPAWAIARAIVGAGSRRRFILVSAAAFTAWDLFLDPQMVAWGFWVWQEPGGYFGIPWLNYGGWFVSAALITAVVHLPSRDMSLPLAPLLFIYALTWALETIGLLVFWGLVGPALCGFVGMGLFVWLCLRRAADEP